MENIFNFKRFWLLVRKHANENQKIFIILFVIMILLAIYWQWQFNKQQDTVFLTYINCLVLIGGVYTGMFFKEWTYKARAVSLLMLPATALEKFVLVLFYSVVVFIPVFTIVYYSSNVILLKIFHPGIPFLFIDQYRGLSPLPAVIIYALLPYILSNSMILLFSVWFKNRQTVKALGVIAILFIITNIWNIFFIKWLTDMNFNGVYVYNQYVFFPTVVEYMSSGTKITSLLITNISIMILAISTLLFYLASYFKLKEKEI